MMPLVPEYVSSVDSGNLAGYLLATRMGLLQLVAEPRIHLRALDGMREALHLCSGGLAWRTRTARRDLAILAQARNLGENELSPRKLLSPPALGADG